MRCLYCGKELALLKRMRGGGDFCSDAHKQSYQEEYNRLALGRLLQAQKKGQPALSVAAQNIPPALQVPPPPDISVAVEELALDPAPAEPVSEASPEAVAEPEPLKTAGLLYESPAPLALPEERPYQEAWREVSAGPAMSELPFRDGAHGLRSADLLSLDLRPRASSMPERASWEDISARAFPGAQLELPLSTGANRRRTASAAIAMDIPPSAAALNADQSLVEAVAFESEVLFDDSPLLELSLIAMDFPAVEELPPESPQRRPVAELFDVAIKIFPPAKPAFIGGDALPAKTAPLTPHLKALPLRPKMALANSYIPPSPPQIADESKPDLPEEVAGPVQAAEAQVVDRKPEPVQRAEQPARPSADSVIREAVPSFGVALPANASWLGSLKAKLGIAILLLLIAGGYFLGWGGAKSAKTAGWNPSVSSDVSGPNIILGEGGWVEDWGGDPSGMHAGRKITIYRPSLKLSDYRLEFQAGIDAKSIGWVFRALDPENYYAMKLMTVTGGLSPKVALFKYLVVNGKQTQVGRLPIDIAVGADTVFDVRVDVRGNQFTTYIQGRQVDSWTDDQLKVGGAGFLNEREERGRVKTVSIRYLSGGGQ